VVRVTSKAAVSARVGGICALLAFLAFAIGSIAGGLAQPDAYSSAHDDLSDLGALTANSAWLYNLTRSRPTSRASSLPSSDWPSGAR